MKHAIFVLLVATLLHAALAGDECSKKNLRCNQNLVKNYAVCLYKGYDSRKCKATTVMNLPFDGDCCQVRVGLECATI